MPRAEPRSGGPQAEHGEDPPVDAIDGGFRPQQHQRRTRRRGMKTIPIPFLMLSPHYFRRVREGNVRMFVRVEPDARGGGECILRVVAAPAPCART